MNSENQNLHISYQNLLKNTITENVGYFNSMTQSIVRGLANEDKNVNKKIKTITKMITIETHFF